MGTKWWIEVFRKTSAIPLFSIKPQGLERRNEIELNLYILP